MKTKHTEGKIKATEPCAGDEYYFGHGNEIRIEDSEGNLLMVGHGNTEKDIANAARLALAWNCHDEFKSVVRRLVSRAYSEGMHTNCTCFRCQDIEQAQAILSKSTSAD